MGATFLSTVLRDHVRSIANHKKGTSTPLTIEEAFAPEGGDAAVPKDGYAPLADTVWDTVNDTRNPEDLTYQEICTGIQLHARDGIKSSPYLVVQVHMPLHGILSFLFAVGFGYDDCVDSLALRRSGDSGSGMNKARLNFCRLVEESLVSLLRPLRDVGTFGICFAPT